MGDTKRKRKLFSRPKKLFDRARMDEENILIKRYGLKNKREIWIPELLGGERDVINHFFSDEMRGMSDSIGVDLFDKWQC